MKFAFALVSGVAATSREDTTKDQFLTEVSGKQFFADLYADWCPHCMAMKSEMTKLIGEYTSSSTVHVASGKCEYSDRSAGTAKELCNYYNLPHYPFLIYGTDGKKQGEYGGSRTASAMKSFIDGGFKSDELDSGVQTCNKESLASLAAQVNAGNHGWTAAVPDRFESLEAVKATLGAFLPGDAEYQEPEVQEVLFTGDLPESFDSAANWPKCSVIANVRDQSNCGTCWAFGSVESFESRACIETGNDIKYSPEDTGFCSSAGFGCNGGNSAWNWFESSGVVTGGDYTDKGSGETCYPYSLAPCAHHVPATAKYPACPGEGPSPQCTRSCTDSGYSKGYSSDKVRASSAYSVRGEQQIMQELVNNGPMYVAFSVYGDFPNYKSGVYKHTSGSMLGGHAVLMVGYGEENGEKYWKIKNSWNEQWGDAGHFKILRGSNECGIEGSVSAGKVSASTVV